MDKIVHSLDGDNREAEKKLDIVGSEIMIKECENKEELKEWIELVQDTAPVETIQRLKQALSKLEKSNLWEKKQKYDEAYTEYRTKQTIGDD